MGGTAGLIPGAAGLRPFAKRRARAGRTKAFVATQFPILLEGGAWLFPDGAKYFSYPVGKVVLRRGRLALSLGGYRSSDGWAGGPTRGQRVAYSKAAGREQFLETRVEGN